MDNEIKKTYHSGYTKGLGFGLILMLIGVLFLGFNFGILGPELKRVFFSWPMILVLIGVVNLFKRHFTSGTILLVIGGFFLMPRVISAYPAYFPGMDGGFTYTYWPVLLIIAGILLIISKIFGKNWGFVDNNNDKQCGRHHHHHQNYNYEKYYKNSEFSKNSIFGAGEHIVLDPVFKGGELNAVFGGITLDLRKTTLAEGDTRVDINAVFGGVTIIVPPDWYIETRLDSVFGGFEDKRFKIENPDMTRKLIITGACVFGGGELRD
ncbi:MAG: hypothetical protein H6Q20_1616 [Bacteroidetes bacterium]|nr:hypothetical protein [Bacteroidota bacterium]